MYGPLLYIWTYIPSVDIIHFYKLINFIYSVLFDFHSELPTDVCEAKSRTGARFGDNFKFCVNWLVALRDS